MWRDRFNDLWLWPMPDWFVAACNRVGGTIVLDVMAVAGLAGLGLLLVGQLADSAVAYWAGWVLAFPAILLLGLMLTTAMWRSCVEQVSGIFSQVIGTGSAAQSNDDARE